MTAQPDFEDFAKVYASCKTQLIWRWTPADLETPAQATLKLCGHDPYSFLLESVEGGATLGRYSVIGYAPDLHWKCDRGAVQIFRGKWKSDRRAGKESLLATLEESRIDVTPKDLPPMAVSGLFGYFGYDMVRLLEKIPDENPDETGIPDSILIRPTVLVIFDNIKSMMCIVTPIYQHKGNSKEEALSVYNRGVTRINSALEKLQAPLPAGIAKKKTALALPLPVTSNMNPEEYKSIVRKAVEYIKAGEIFQVVPSQRFSVPFDLPGFELYRSLRRLNPSPFLFYLNFDGFSIVGSSPEILVRLRDNMITIRPIAGTRKRGATPAEDEALAADLLADPKERAEHLMLLDLGRNDVGRVAEIGSVKVTEQFIIEKYSHVMHIVSNVEGKLRKGLNMIEALLAGFPAGTVSGAPKIRAMEIIDELEPLRRGIYGGGAGYFSGNGEMDTCIALRTALVKDGKMYVQAGAGIVADSVADLEEQETRNKAQALISAAEAAVQTALA